MLTRKENKQEMKINLNIIINKRVIQEKPLSNDVRNPCSSNFKPSITSTKRNENRNRN